MPLHGKVVVIKRSGVDGTEFPLTAACVFGRKAECDIRIQIPHVSKEHCKIDLNENKEVIITNLSSVNPTRINGEVLQQADRLKHGDIITIIDRSFRFEYPPEPTPKKKRSSIGGKTETLRVLQDKQARDTTAAETVDKTSETPSYPCLKDGTNNDNIQRTPEKMAEVESTDSPFGDLCQMIKKTLDSKSPWKPSGSRPQTPATRFCTPQPVSVRKAIREMGTLPKAEECTPMQVKAEESSGITAVEGDAEVESVVVATPKSVKKEQNSSDVVVATPKSLTSKTPTTVATSSPLSQKKHQSTPKKFTATQMIEQVAVETPTLTPTRRKSKVATPIKPAVTEVQDQTEAVPTVPSTPKTNPSPRHSSRTSEKKRQAQESTPTKPAVTEMQDQAMVTEALPSTPKTNASPRHSPRTAEKKRQAQEVTEAAATVNVTAGKKRKSEELGADMSMPQMKRKRVSFGGHLSPELFDKRMPPDSPLRKGSAPRRSLCVAKLATSLLRRASVSGFPKAKTPSPAKKSLKAKTPSPAKKSPKAKTPSPAKKSPKAKTPSPAKKSPKAKTPTPAKKSPKAKTPSPAKKSPKAKSPSPETPTVQGRFSVSRISTPSPVAEEAISATEPSATMTPKLPLSQKSMKSMSRKSNTMAKNVVEVMRRRSGVSRASLKAQTSWADIVKFGQTKSQVVFQEAKKASVQMKKKKAVQPKHKTPAKNVQSYVSTGHADSPVSIVVGRAHKRHVQPTGAAPRLVHNIVPLKNMKMDEDLTGIADIFNTPVGAKQRKSSVVSVPQSATKTPVSTSVVEASSSVVSVPQSATKTPVSTSVIEASSSVVSVPQSATKTPVSTSVVECSVMNTPEETGEMIVSPLAVASSAKSGKYNHEAVERLFLDDDNSNFVSEEDVPNDDISDQQCPDVETKMTTTPEPIEDLRGKLLKTPKQKAEQVECLTGVKRIMRTPRQKAEPVEDIRGKLLKTPKPEKPEQPECLSGVKRMMKTPKQKAEPVVDLGGELLKTPKAPTVMEEVSVGDIGELLEAPIHKEPLKDLIAVTDVNPGVQSSLLVCTTDAVEGMVNFESLATIEGHGELHPQNESDESQQEPEVETILPVSADDVEVVKEIPVEDENNTSLPAEDEQQASKQPTTTVPVETDASQEPEVETSLPVSVDDAEVVQEIPIEAENNTSLPLEDDQQSSQHPTTTVETDALQEPEVETIVPVSGNNVEVVQEIPIEAENNPSLPADDDQQLGDAQSSTAIEEREMPVLKTRERGRKAKEDLAETQEAHEEAVPAEKPRRGRKIKPETKSVVTHESTEVLDKPLTIATETSKKGTTVKEQTLLTDVISEEPKEKPATTSIAIKTIELPVLKTRGRGRKAEQELPEAVETQEVHKEALIIPHEEAIDIPAEKPRRGGRKTKQEAVEAQKVIPYEEAVVILPEEAVVILPEEAVVIPHEEAVVIRHEEAVVIPHEEAVVIPHEEAVVIPHEEAVIIPAETPQRGGRKIKQGAVEAQEVIPHEEAVIIPAEKPRRGGRKTKQEAVEAQEAHVIQPEEVVVIPAEEVVVIPAEKPQRGGRKTKQEAVETEEAHEEAVVIPAEKPRRGGRKSKQDTQVVAPPESTEAQDLQITLATEKPKRGGRAKTTTVVKEVEIMLEAESAKDDVPEKKLDDVQSSTAIEEKEMPVLKTRGRGRKAKPEAETQEPQMETLPAEKPKRGRKKGSMMNKEVIISEEPEDKPDEHTQDDVQEENTGDVQTADASTAIKKSETPVLKTRGRGRKAKQDLPEAVETEETHEEASVPAEKPKRGGRKIKQETKSVLPTDSTEVQDKPLTITTEVENVSEEPEEKPEPAQDVEEKSVDAPVKARKGRKVHSAVKDDNPQATPTKRARRGETLPSLQEGEVVETAVPVTKSATRGRGRPTSESKSQDADSKTKVSAGPVRKGRKATPPADDTVVVPSTEEVMEEVQDEPQSKKSVMWKDDLSVTHVISPAVRAVRGRKPKPADNVPSPRPSPVKRDQSESIDSIECPASETTALTKTGSKRKAPRNVSKAEEDLANKTVPSEPIKSRAKRVKATDAALVETVTPATEVSETKPRRGRPAKK